MNDASIEYLLNPVALKERRIKKKLSRAQLAKEIGMCDPAYLYQMESKPTKCSIDLATKISKVLKCKVEHLTGEYTK